MCLSFLAGAKVRRLSILTKLFTTFFQKIFLTQKKAKQANKQKSFPLFADCKGTTKNETAQYLKHFFLKNFFPRLPIALFAAIIAKYGYW